MQFSKDILVLDFEGRETPTQIGAVLLDKQTLVEKDSFRSYIFADLGGKVAGKSGITQEMLAGAPTQAAVAEAFLAQFGADIFLGSWVANKDMTYFAMLMQAAHVDTWKAYDYHVFDIWPAAYLYLVQRGYTGGIRSEEMFQYFGAKPRGAHDALEDARLAADVLRKISLVE